MTSRYFCLLTISISLLMVQECVQAAERLNGLKVDKVVSNSDKILKQQKTSVGELVIYDLNLDGKADQEIEYRGKDIVKKSIDRNFDGLYDHFITFYNKIDKQKKQRLIQIEKFDDNHDGKIDHLETVYLHSMIPRYIIVIEMDKDFDGKLEFKTTHTIPFKQQGRYPCRQLGRLDNVVKKLADATIGSVVHMEGGFLLTDFGFKIHNGCLENFKPDFYFVEQLKSAMHKGLACFAKLESEFQKNSQGRVSGALKNAIAIQDLLERSPVSVVCSEHGYNWSSGGGEVMAHASTAEIVDQQRKEFIGDLEVKHPLISINPKYVSKGESDTAQSSYLDHDELQMTLFHEHLHNLGHRHGNGVEYSYACEKCCFSDSAAIKSGGAACRLCTGNYSSELSKKYISDMIEWAESSGSLHHKEMAAKMIEKYLAINPNDRWAIISLLRLRGDGFNPVTMAMAKMLKTRFRNLTEGEKNIFAGADRGANSLEYQKYKNIATTVAAATMHYRFDKGKGEQASLDSLSEGIDQLAKLRVKMNNQAEFKQLSYTEQEMIRLLVESADDVMIDIFITQDSLAKPAEQKKKMFLYAYELLEQSGRFKK